MATKKKTSKKTKSQEKFDIDRSEIVRWVIGFFAFFIILTFIPAIGTGWIGGTVSGCFKGLFGPMYYVVPFLILLVDIFWDRDHKNKVARIKYTLYILEFLFLSMIVHIIAARNGDPAFSQLYATGKELQSAGLISGGLALIFTGSIGSIASLALGILGVFICTVFLLGTTPKATVSAVAGFAKDKYVSMRERAAERRAEEDEEEEEEAPAPKKAKKSSSAPVSELPEDPAASTDPVEIPVVIESFSDPILQPKPQQESVSEPEPAPEPIPEPAPDPAIAATLEEEEDLYLDPIEDTPYVMPPLSLLTEDDGSVSRPTPQDLERNSRKLETVLASFNVKAKVVSTSFGPTVTRYELQPETGVRVRQIANLADDIALHLAATAVRIENIPGKVAIGIEIPNKNVSTVRLRGLIESPVFRDAKSRLLTALGEDVAGNPVYLDIAKMPHLLIAGATGMGKSVCMNSLIISLLYRAHPDEVKMILIDPKRVELTDYNGIPHLLVPVINEPKKAAGTLNWLCAEMERRYTLIQEVGARDLMGYNLSVVDDPERETMPQIVIIIDELADLMMTAPDDVETSICRLAQKARAAGMHLVIGTQRPSVDVITGLIKANIPSRIAFTVQSQVDSRTILDTTGAEKLLGRGDMLYYPVGAMKPIRVQGAFVDGKAEVGSITQFIKEAATARYDESIMAQIEQEAKLCGLKGKRGAAAAAAEEAEGDDHDDPMLLNALEVALECGTVSTSLLQRRLSLGYARAARIVDKMERKQFIGEFDPATKKRSILITREEFLEMKLNSEQKNGGGSNE